MTIYVVTTGALNGRAEPVSGKVLYVRHKGDKLNIRKTKTINGQLWGETQHGTWYSLRYLRRQGAAPVSRVGSPVPGYRVTTPYGRRKAGLWRTKGYHTGDDYAAPQGAPVVAVRAGTIIRRWDSVLGNVVLLYADNGKTYWYCHLSGFVGASGRKVKRGEKIGKVGQTGTGARGPHLHFEQHAGHSASWWAKDSKPAW